MEGASSNRGVKKEKDNKIGRGGKKEGS